MSENVLDNNEELIEQKSAIKNYLESLLDVAPTKPKATEKSKASTDAPDPAIQTVVPKWAEHGFSALYFRSAGLHLFIPVPFVRGIKNVKGRIQAVEGASEWIKGKVETKHNSITIIDTEKLIIPSKKRTVEYNHPDRNAYAILLGDGSMGISCDTIGQVKQVAPGEIHWRAREGKRTFLFGMFKSEVAGLVDARRIALAVSMDSTLV